MPDLHLVGAHVGIGQQGLGAIMEIPRDIGEVLLKTIVAVSEYHSREAFEEIAPLRWAASFASRTGLAVPAHLTMGH